MIKPRVVFPFVEAGFGHIMPMRCVLSAFEKKYGKYCEIIKTNFYQDTKNQDMIDFEQFLISEVKKHNKKKGYGKATFFLLGLFGNRLSNIYLFQKRVPAVCTNALKYIEELKPDLIMSTHWSTEHYALTAKLRGVCNPKIATYCPDPIIGRQWDNRVDLMIMSSAKGREVAIKKRKYKTDQIKVSPFLIRKEIEEVNKGKEFYREKFNFPKDNFTILLADGGYGAGKLQETTELLLQSDLNLTVISVCGKNPELYEYLKTLKPKENIHFSPYGFTSEILELTACSDLFIGKSGASSLAEPIYFGCPAIITLFATPIEKWIGEYYAKDLNCAVIEFNPQRAVALAESWAKNPSLMKKYQENTLSQHRTDGGEIAADYLWEELVDKFPELKEIQL